MILSLDPSLTCTGYAFLTDAGRIRAYGRIRPPSSRYTLRHRLTSYRTDLDDLLDEAADLAVDRIVAEVPSGHVGRKRHQGAGAGLSLYGLAVGYTIAIAERVAPVQLVSELDWTDGTPKARRVATVANTVRGYDAQADPGGDIADAIALARWFLTVERVQKR